MKKELKILAVVLATIIFFLAGFGIGSKKGLNLNVNSGTEIAAVGQADNASQP